MTYRTVVSLIAVVVATFVVAQPSEGQEGLASISGSIFEDLDRDGVLDAGEVGITRIVTLHEDGVQVQKDGGESYAFDELEAGVYTVVFDPQPFAEIQSCDLPGSHRPYFATDCGVNQAPKWKATSPESAELTLSPGDSVTLDFGARMSEVLVVNGGAILNDDYAPDGTLIEAVGGGTTCGQATVDASRGRFRLEVSGASEVEGCAKPGDRVRLLVGNVPAIETITWDAQRKHLGLNLAATPNHAWYWISVPHEGSEGAEGETADASIDGSTCGQATITQAPPGFSPLPGPLGFSRLVIPRDTVETGCGHEGATVSFQINGEEFATAAWAPGVHQLTAETLPVGPTILPKTGSMPASGHLPLVAAVATVVAMAGAAAMYLGLRRTW